MIDLPISNLLENSKNLEGSVVFVTGGASGFGKGISLLAAQNGAKVVIADVNSEASKNLALEISASGGECTVPFSSVDVRDPASVREAFDHCSDKYGRPPDIVVVNAGVSANDWFEDEMEVPAENSRPAHPGPPRALTLSVNFQGAISTADIGQEYWTAHPGPKNRRLILMSSLGGMAPLPGGTMYAASKHGLLGYWKALSNRLASDREDAAFECHAICPNFAITSIFERSLIFLLSGYPLVPVDLVVRSVIYAASRPSTSTAPTGSAILLPDDQDPALITYDEYDPLSGAVGVAIDSRSLRFNAWSTVNPSKRYWRDLAVNMYGISFTDLTIRVILIIAGVLGLLVPIFSRIGTLLPIWAAVLTGVVLGLGIRMKKKDLHDVQT